MRRAQLLHVTRGSLTTKFRIQDPATGRIPPEMERAMLPSSSHCDTTRHVLLTPAHLTPWPQTMRRSQGQTSDTSLPRPHLTCPLYWLWKQEKSDFPIQRTLQRLWMRELWRCDILSDASKRRRKIELVVQIEFSGLELRWKPSPDLVVAQSVSSIWL